MVKYITHKTVQVNTTGYSPGFALGPGVIAGLMPKTGWDTTATHIVVEASPDEGTTWYPLNDAAGSVYVRQVAAGQYTPVEVDKTAGVSYVRLRSAVSVGTLTAQGAAVDVVVAIIPFYQ